MQRKRLRGAWTLRRSARWLAILFWIKLSNGENIGAEEGNRKAEPSFPTNNAKTSIPKRQGFRTT
jgi:hypothetical protein